MYDKHENELIIGTTANLYGNIKHSLKKRERFHPVKHIKQYSCSKILYTHTKIILFYIFNAISRHYKIFK